MALLRAMLKYRLCYRLRASGLWKLATVLAMADEALDGAAHGPTHNWQGGVMSQSTLVVGDMAASLFQKRNVDCGYQVQAYSSFGSVINFAWTNTFLSLKLNSASKWPRAKQIGR